jgi:hypothetical protein
VGRWNQLGRKGARPRERVWAAVKEKEKKEKDRVGLKIEKLRRERLRGDFRTFELFILKPHINQKPCN